MLCDNCRLDDSIYKCLECNSKVCQACVYLFKSGNDVICKDCKVCLNLEPVKRKI